MRSIGTMACYALVIAFALLVMPTGALAQTFTIVDVPGAEAAGINPQGDIVGFYVTGTENRGFLLDKEGTLTTIYVPGASVTRARGISPQGDIVGFYGDAGGATHGFLRDKKGTFTTIDVPGASFTEAIGVNPRGDIVGRYSAGGTFHGFLAQ